MPEPKPSESLVGILKDPALVIWGRAVSDAKLLREQLNHLPVAEVDYHGTLQVINSAIQRLRFQARDLLDIYEGDQMKERLEAAPPQPKEPASVAPRSRKISLAPEAAKRVSVRERIMNIIRASENDALTAGAIMDQIHRAGIAMERETLTNTLEAMRTDGMLKLTATGFWMVA